MDEAESAIVVATAVATGVTGWSGLRAAILLAIGFWLAKLVSRKIATGLRGKLDNHLRGIIDRTIFYLILCLFVISALWELGFSLEVLVGAAGILTIAVGFASQTTASNFISGLFLLGERPFGVGDLLRVGDIVGEVIAIDPLAVKLRTFDNRQVRIPNETLLKTEIVTLTKFSIRRIDLMVGVAYKENLDKVRSVLLSVADRNYHFLDEPEPLFMISGFGSSSIDIQFSVWTNSEGYLYAKTALFMEIKKAFDLEGIEIPFPHLSFYAGSATRPLPVDIRKSDEKEVE